MSTALSQQTPTARKTDLVVNELADELVLYDLKTNQLHTLNPTAAFVWRQCDGRTAVATIAQRFTGQYGLDDGADLVWSALDQLDRQNLLQSGVNRPTWVAGITRRDLMKRVAAGAFVALPLVRSLAAPTPAQAQSGPTTTFVPCAGLFWQGKD
jgi:hypothetical protein